MDWRIDGESLSLHPAWVARWMAGDPQGPLYVEIAPTGGCNHRCTFCAVDYLGYDGRHSLSAELLIDRVQEMADTGVAAVMWAGEGEPLLHPSLPRVLAETARELRHAITTNGIALTGARFAAGLNRATWIKVSINAGDAATYQRIHHSHPGDWGKLWTNLLDCCRLGGPTTLGAQAVVLPETVHTLAELAGRCRDAGLRYLVLKPYSQHGKSLTRQYEGTDYAGTLGEAMDQVAATSTGPGFEVVVRHQAMAQVTAEDRGYTRCQATPHAWAYVMATGDVYSCSAYLGDPRFRLGSLVTTPWRDLWFSPARDAHATFVQECLDISECRKACRMDQVNRYLWRVRHPEPHDAFI